MNIVSISEYAVMCGISKTAVYTRIKNKEIKTVVDKKFCGLLIDADKYPPMAEKKRGRKSYKEVQNEL